MTTEAARQGHAPSLIGLANSLVRPLIGAGLPFGPNVLLTVRGRSSGLPRTFPVAILDLDGRRFVQSPFGEVNWVRNLRAAGEATLTRGRHAERVLATELSPEQAGPILRDALAPYLRSRLAARFARRFFAVQRDSDLAAYVAEAGRHPMFELVVAPAL